MVPLPRNPDSFLWTLSETIVLQFQKNSNNLINKIASITGISIKLMKYLLGCINISPVDGSIAYPSRS